MTTPSSALEHPMGGTGWKYLLVIALLLPLQQQLGGVTAFTPPHPGTSFPKRPPPNGREPNTPLNDIPPEQEQQEPKSIPPMMSRLSMENNSNPINWEQSNSPLSNRTALEEKAVVSPSTGLHGYEESNLQKDDDPVPTAPQVNQWTEIMTQGMFFEKKRSEAIDQIYKDLSDMSPHDCGEVDKYWERLKPTISYLRQDHVSNVYDALRVAYRAHRGQMRKSGEPFIIHPVEVALLLSGLRMDAETVMAGLLHDTVEDTELTFELVEEMFGYVVRSIVEGETKVSKLPKLAFSDYADEQAENLRQMFVAMSDDYRIIIVKLADRLHNMRTLQHMKPEKQIKISRETLDIFAPLAHRMGIWQFKSELEDTSFMYLYPLEYKRLNKRLRQHQKRFRETLDKSQEIMTRVLKADPTLRQQAADITVSGRRKELYSLWTKMESKNERNLDHIGDVVALRVVIDPLQKEETNDENAPDRGVWLCYHVLGLVQHLPGFQPLPTRVKDYISFPKPNGYQSLHTALILDGQTIEVQIRTSLMHTVAEYGMASHWAYKDAARRNNDLYNTPWLSSIKEWQNDNVMSARDFVDSVRSELLGKRVFVFLRNGKILNLARGATAVDVAFQIHTEVGLNMHGAEINGKPVPISYELRNGDVVFILTGEGQPSTDWMRYAKSRSTRTKLRQYFRSKQRESLREAGEILLIDYLTMHGDLIKKESFIEHDFRIPTVVEEIAVFLPDSAQFDDIDDLLLTIGKQNDRNLLHAFASKLFKVPHRLLVDAEKDREILPKTVADAVSESRRVAKAAEDAVESAILDESEQLSERPLPEPPIVLPVSFERGVKNLINTTIEIADPDYLCDECLPLFGDEIIGTRAEGSPEATPVVHRVGCHHAQRAINRALAESKRHRPGGSDKDIARRVDSVTLRRNVNNRFTGENSTPEVPVTLEWPDAIYPEEHNMSFLCEIVVHCQDRKLLLADCSEIVSELSEIIKTGSLTTNEHATLEFLVNVQSIAHLQKLMNGLRQVRSVMSVERRFGSEMR